MDNFPDDRQFYTDFMRRRLAANLEYWQAYITSNRTDIVALDQERAAILKAIALALKLRTAWSQTRDVAIALSSYMERRGHWEQWRWILEQTIDAARQIGTIADEITLSVLLARLLQGQLNLKQAGLHYRRVIRLARRSGDRFSSDRFSSDRFNEARACSNLGFLYIEPGHWWRAEILCCHALSIFEQLDSKHGRAHTENHLGFLYLRQCLWDKARRHLERACALWQTMGDRHGLMRGSINLAALYNDLEQPGQSLLYLERALEQARLTGEEAELGTIYMNLGVAYRLNGDPVQAEQYAYRAEAIFRRFANSLHLALVRINLGGACLDQQQWAAAHSHLEKSLVACRQLNNSYGQIKALLGMVEYELARDNSLGATTRLGEAQRLIDREQQKNQYAHLQMLITKYRHRLNETD